MTNLNYEKIEIQSYMSSKNIFPQLSKQIFKWRTRMMNFKKNFINGFENISCKFGCDCFDSQEHSLNCDAIKTKMTDLPDTTNQYRHLFSRNISKIKSIVILLNKAYKVRESLLESMN